MGGRGEGGGGGGFCVVCERFGRLQLLGGRAYGSYRLKRKIF